MAQKSDEVRKFSSEATCTDFDMPAANVTVIAKFSVVASEHTISLTAGNNGKVKIADGEPAQTPDFVNASPKFRFAVR